MLNAIREDRTPNLLLMCYALATWEVRDLLLIPSFVFSVRHFSTQRRKDSKSVFQHLCVKSASPSSPKAGFPSLVSPAHVTAGPVPFIRRDDPTKNQALVNTYVTPAAKNLSDFRMRRFEFPKKIGGKPRQTRGCGHQTIQGL